MPKITVRFPPLHPAQQKIHDSRARFRVAVCGVRFRKSSLAVMESLEVALQGGNVWYVTPNYPLSVPPWRMLTRAVQQIPGMASGIKESERTVHLPGGGFVSVKSAAAKEGLRAEGLSFLVVDEAAYIAEGVWESQLRGRLTDKQGRALFITSPAGKNWVARRYDWGQGEDAEWESWRFATWDNPAIPASERESLERAVREGRFSSTRYRQEYLAEFVEFEGQVFRRISEAARAEHLDEARPGHTYVIGVDWARTDDSTVFAVLEVETRQFVVIDSFAGVDYPTQRARLRGLYERFRRPRVIAESNSMGLPLIEELRREGMYIEEFYTQGGASGSKARAVEELQLAFESGTVAIPNDPATLSEFELYQRETLPSGAPKYGAPEGCHDDRVTACFIAWSGLDGGFKFTII